MEIVKAKIEEKEQFNQVLIDAATRIKTKGSVQWRHVLEGKEKKQIEEKILTEDAYFFKDGEKIIGAFYLYQKPTDWDVMLWGDEELQGVYYLHKLSLAMGNTGKGMAKEMLLAMQEMYNDADHPVEIRLDCMAEQPVLNNLYSGSGFTFLKKIKDVQADYLLADFNLYTWRNKKYTVASF